MSGRGTERFLRFNILPPPCIARTGSEPRHNMNTARGGESPRCYVYHALHESCILLPHARCRRCVCRRGGGQEGPRESSCAPRPRYIDDIRVPRACYGWPHR
eukprot:3392378-Amphidinium_carterae.2